jgi:glycosyltransferase involved in cell wall biosynthesis
MDQLPVAIVLPCLDEESTFLETCRSLGFAAAGIGQQTGVHLIIVDNGSTDRTLEIVEFIDAHSMPGSVCVVEESERGFVPPRHTGTQRARYLAEAAGWSDVLIVQTDADTAYTEGYVGRLRAAAAAAGRNALLEGTAEDARVPEPPERPRREQHARAGLSGPAQRVNTGTRGDSAAEDAAAPGAEEPIPHLCHRGQDAKSHNNVSCYRRSA